MCHGALFLRPGRRWARARQELPFWEQRHQAGGEGFRLRCDVSRDKFVTFQTLTTGLGIYKTRL